MMKEFKQQLHFGRLPISTRDHFERHVKGDYDRLFIAVNLDAVVCFQHNFFVRGVLFLIKSESSIRW